MAYETGKTINMISNTFQNTWRNFVFAVVCGCVVISGSLYVLYRELYSAIKITEDQSTAIVLTEPAKQVKGVTEYRPYVIGGDVVSTILIPEKREMFIPFDIRRISATAVIIKDVGTGQVLFGKNEYTPHALASVTKLMSALVLEDQVTDWEIEGVVPADTIFDSHVYAGEVATLDHWYRTALVGSSNRAILTLVDASGLSREEFVLRMNEKARELGMSDTVFTDPTGIDSGNISTASDAAILLAEALRNERIIATLSLHSVDHLSSFTQKQKTIWSTNWLLTDWVHSAFDAPVIGKTGYIVESGYNFVGKFVKSDDTSIEVIVLGSENEETRFTDAATLAEWAFTNYEWNSL